MFRRIGSLDEPVVDLDLAAQCCAVAYEIRDEFVQSVFKDRRHVIGLEMGTHGVHQRMAFVAHAVFLRQIAKIVADFAIAKRDATWQATIEQQKTGNGFGVDFSVMESLIGACC